MSPAAAVMNPSTRPDAPRAIVFLSASERDGSVEYTNVSNYATNIDLIRQ